MFIIEDEKQELFEFQINGVAHSAPLVGDLPYKKLIEFKAMSADGADGIDAIKWLVDNVFEAEEPGLLDGLTVSQMNELVAAYNKASGLGE